jgi:hypothetical protein
MIAFPRSVAERSFLATMERTVTNGESAPVEPQAIASAPYRRYVSGEQAAAVRHSGEHGDRLRKWRINERLSHVRVATLVCSYGLSRTDGSGDTFRARKGGRL